MTNPTTRSVELLVAAACAALAVAKLFGAPPDISARAVAAAVGVVEATLAAWLVDGRRPRLAATSVAAFGVALAVATAFAAPPGADAGGCGCLGPFHADQSRRFLVAGALVVLAGLRLAVDPAPDGRRATAGSSTSGA
jgi:hypothetical protein